MKAYNKKQLSRLSRFLNEYCQRMGVPVNRRGRGLTVKEMIIRLSQKKPDITDAVGFTGGKVTNDVIAALHHYASENPVDGFYVPLDAHLAPAKAASEVAKSLGLVAAPMSGKATERRRAIKLRTRQQSQLDRSLEAFYKSWEWSKVRYQAIQKHGGTCMCCGAGRGDVTEQGKPVRIVVDHIKPVRKHWSLRLDPDNLQVLCDTCNKGKASWDQTDWRRSQPITPPCHTQGKSIP